MQRAQDRAVAAEHDAQLDVARDVAAEREPGALTERVLGALLGVEAQRDAGLRGARGEQLERRAGLVGAAVGEDGDLSHGSTSRAIRSSASASGGVACPRAGSASHTNVSRLPLGPGSPEEM